MKKFNYSLEKVLRIKNDEFEQRKLELLQIRNAIDEVEVLIIGCKQKQQTLALNYQSSMIKGMSGDLFKRHVFQQNALKQQVEDLKVQQVELKKREQEKLQEVLHKKSEVSGLEKLKTYEKERYDLAQLRQNQQEIDELLVRKVYKDKDMSV